MSSLPSEGIALMPNDSFLSLLPLTSQDTNIHSLNFVLYLEEEELSVLSLFGVYNFISLYAALSTKKNYLQHEIFSRSITLLVIISRISNDLRCKTFCSSSIQRKKYGKLTYIHVSRSIKYYRRRNY
jgi:hypothetical protein